MLSKSTYISVFPSKQEFSSTEENELNALLSRLEEAGLAIEQVKALITANPRYFSALSILNATQNYLLSAKRSLCDAVYQSDSYFKTDMKNI